MLVHHIGVTKRTDLVEENSALHARLEEKLLSTYDALTELALDEANRRWGEVKAMLASHMAFEEEHLVPRVDALVKEHAPSNDTLARQVAGDHEILVRTERKIDAALARLGENPTSRRAMVLELDTFLLLRRVLEHHTLRETQQAYPLLDEHLDDDEHARVLAGLRASG
jgi:hypothetical protein